MTESGKIEIKSDKLSPELEIYFLNILQLVRLRSLSLRRKKPEPDKEND